ncbi:hypothetical protein GCM10010923_10480 [Blastomonas marina]|uniref:JmjC domain-containing protein n=1 Tax=Blastomonas marina TaxID=1867408 RepID=A0ABQ1F9G2_9SPHN|nr:cupin domain-containing protein [Blastomonas marina]GGA03508.1 hypothetical protein GCM10010923_10480 [Blastomonas marina]
MSAPTFAEFLAPMSGNEFDEGYYGRAPHHIVGGADAPRAAMMRWKEVSDLVGLLPQWRETGLKLVLNRQRVAQEHYVTSRETAAGRTRQPDPGLVEVMMDLGASLVLDGIEDIRPDIRSVCAMLSREFAAKVGVNLYASKRGIQGFASHCDPHEVFVVQCEGEKDWTIYDRRAEVPTTATVLQDQDAIERSKGAPFKQVRMRPGDLLYIPRGFYHDAIAVSDRSLHLTFAVQPLYGTVLLDLARDLALDDPAFREYLPSGEAAPEALQAHLAMLAERLGSILTSKGFAEDVVVRQRGLHAPEQIADNSARPAQAWRRTQVPLEIRQPLSGSVAIAGDATYPLGYLAEVAHWLAGASMFQDRQLRARFSHHPAGEIDALLEWFAQQRLVEPI